MKRFLFSVVITGAALLGSCSDGWKVYDTGEFTIEFPGYAKDTATISNNLAGARTYYEPPRKSLDSNVYYAVSVYTLPDTISILGSAMDEYFRTDVNIYAWSIDGVLADSGRVVKSGNVEGREYKVNLGQNAGISTVRKFAYGRHLYTLLVVTGNCCLENKGIERFMNSFKLKSVGKDNSAKKESVGK